MRTYLFAGVLFLMVGFSVAGERDTDHLAIRWDDGMASEQEVELAAERGEEWYAAIEALVGHAPSNRIPILLRGPAEQPDGSWDYPRVDGWGRVHLFRYTDEPDNALNAMAHEMVHAFRMDRKDKDWFLEEGFAEYVALKVDPSLEGFPWYGFPVEVVAGHWIAQDLDLPMTDLRDSHQELSLPCKLQSYAQRASFFLWLEEQFGGEAVLALMEATPTGTDADFEEAFGATLADLAGQWRADALNAFQAHEGAVAAAKRYRGQSPAKYQDVCDP